MTVYAPTDAAELAEILGQAALRGDAFELVAGGSKQELGRPVQAAHTLDLRGLAGIIEYEPAELVLTALPGTTMAEIEAVLDTNRQMLAFEPPDWRVLLGTPKTQPTLGGTIACNLSGPRRPKAGAARDHLLGFHAVNGSGEVIKAGGRVVKNVTGYDLPKLLTGSFGTLAALTELSVKVLPRPETERSLLLAGLADDVAIRGLAAALNSPHEASCAAHLTLDAARGSAVATVSSAGRAVTALRVEGPEPSAGPRCAALAALLAEAGDATILEAQDSNLLWREIGAGALLPSDAATVWRISTAPAAAAALVAEIAQRLPVISYYDWAGGLIWLAVMAERPDGGSEAVRVKTVKHGGHATLIRAPSTIRAAGSVFEPLSPALLALTARVKASFDPARILNPGRMYAGL